MQLDPRSTQSDTPEGWIYGRQQESNGYLKAFTEKRTGASGRIARLLGCMVRMHRHDAVDRVFYAGSRRMTQGCWKAQCKADVR